jgi:hypothetical protein
MLSVPKVDARIADGAAKLLEQLDAISDNVVLRALILGTAIRVNAANGARAFHERYPNASLDQVEATRTDLLARCWRNGQTLAAEDILRQTASAPAPMGEMGGPMNSGAGARSSPGPALRDSGHPSRASATKFRHIGGVL